MVTKAILTKDMKNMILVKMGSNGKPYFVATVQGSSMGLRLRRPDAAFVRYTTGHDKPHYPVPAIAHAEISYYRAYGPEHGPCVSCVTIWHSTHATCFAQWSRQDGQEYGTYFERGKHKGSAQRIGQ